MGGGGWWWWLVVMGVRISDIFLSDHPFYRWPLQWKYFEFRSYIFQCAAFKYYQFLQLTIFLAIAN